MPNLRRAVVLAAALVLPANLAAQSTTSVLKGELLGHFNESMGKVIALAEAMPADRYGWSPDAATMPVAQVYAHIARYNFYYPSSSMGVAVPMGIGLDSLEAMRDKAQVVLLLKRSADHVRTTIGGMAPAQLDRMTKLYGREVPQWAVLVQLVAHMNEHLGQSIAYARSNNVVPPWSR